MSHKTHVLPTFMRTISGRMVQRILAAMTLVFTFRMSAEAQANFESNASGPWNAAASWLLVSGTDADGIPDANDGATVKNGHTITIGSANRNCANLSVDAGGTLSVDNSGSIRINASPGSAAISGTVLISNSGTLQETGTGTRSLVLGTGGKLTISSTATFPTFDTFAFDPNSTVEFTASANQTIKSGVVFGNLHVSGGGKKTVAPIPSDTTFTTNGTITIGSGTILDVSTNLLYVHFNGDVQIDGTLDASVGTVVVEMHGAHWTNNGIHLCSVKPGYGHQPTTTFYNTQITGSTATQKFYDVCFEGSSSTFTSLDSLRNVEIRPGATYSTGSSTTNRLRGNWINNGTYTSNNATVSLIGTSDQTIAGSTFSNLVVDNPGGVTLTDDVTIAASGVLTLTNGNISTGNHVLSIENPSPSALALGSNKIFGKVTRAIADGSTATYNFLSVNAFVTPNGVGNPSSISMAEYPNVNPPGLAPTADTNKIVKRYYNITENDAGSGFVFTMRLPYLQSEARGNEASYALFRDGGSGWANMGSTIVDVTNNYVQQSGLTDLSIWAIAEGDQTLPIQLSHFVATVVQNTNNVRLAWGTLTETNNFGFYIQRSVGTENNYSDLPSSFVPGHGTTIEPHEYSWTNVGVEPGTYYYRLKQVDLDGMTHFTDGIRLVISSIMSVRESVPKVFNLEPNYPNPFNPSTTIAFTVEKKDFTTLTVHNILGQKISTLYSGMAVPGERYDVKFEGNELTNGIYFIRLTSSNNSAIRKMILVK